MPNLIDRIATRLGYTKEKQNLPAWYLASAEVNSYGGIQTLVFTRTRLIFIENCHGLTLLLI
jgi:hypothetical protein